MRLFDEDRLIFGPYAVILRKYCKSGERDSNSPEWKISSGEDSGKPVKLFDAYIDCLYAAATIALAKRIKRKDPLAPAEKKDHVSILASAWKNRVTDFIYLYRLMILVDPDLELSKDERVKKAFSVVPDENTDHEFNFFLQYAYAGLEELDRLLTEVKTYTELANFACKTVLEYSGEDDEEE